MILSAALVFTAVLALNANAWRLFGAPTQLPLTVSSRPAGGPGQKRAITPEISAFAETLLEAANVPGLSVGVVRLDEGEVNVEYGSWGNMTEDGAAVQADTLFSIGSCSKAFLASAMGILIDDFANGRNVTALPPSIRSFTWDTKVQRLLPELWKLADDRATENANIRDILSHVSGLPRHDFSYHRDDTPSSLLRRLQYLKPAYELREHWSYNNQMFIVASHIISTYSGKPFRKFVKERIFAPLNMTSTTYSGDEALASGLLSQSWTDTGRRIPYYFLGETMSTFIAGAGGVLSNAIDMSKWAAMLLNAGVDPQTNRTIIPRSTFEEMTTAHTIVLGKPLDPLTSIVGYGMGWMRASYQGHDLVEHGGAVPGFLTELVFLPADRIAVFGFVNLYGPHDVQTLVPLRIVEDLLGLKHAVGAMRLGSSTVVSPNPMANSKAAELHSSPTVPLELYEGIYYDPGYGSLDFCTLSSRSPDCARVLSDFASISPNKTLSPDTLYARSSRVAAGHISMRRVHAKPDEGVESFLLSGGTIFPNGYGRNTMPFAEGLSGLEFEAIDVQCAVGREPLQVVGCGVMNIEEGRKTTEGSIQERADVWLAKVPKV